MRCLYRYLILICLFLLFAVNAYSFKGSGQQYIHQLVSGDFVAMRLAAATMVQRREMNIEVLDVVAEVLLQNYQGANAAQTDTWSWLCKALGASRNSRYKATLKEVLSNTRSAKLKKYARYSFRQLGRSYGEQYIRGSVDLSDPLGEAQEKEEESLVKKTFEEISTGIQFVWIPSKCYSMGQTYADKQILIRKLGQGLYNKRHGNEHPSHRVCLSGFWMAETEVTYGQFKQFVQDTEYKTDADKEGNAWIKNENTDWKWEKKSGYSWEKTGYDQTDNHPAACISWNDAMAFVEWLNKKTGESFDLPTEAQWEYAAQMNNYSNICQYANIADKGARSGDVLFCDDGYVFTSPAGTFKANKAGVYDILGNVWEWCKDVYDKEAYSKHSQKDPLIASGSTQRVLRGGSWDFDPRGVTAQIRGGNSATLRYSCMGFRVVKND